MFQTNVVEKKSRHVLYNTSLVSKTTLSSTLKTHTHNIRKRRFESYYILPQEEISSYGNVAYV